MTLVARFAALSDIGLQRETNEDACEAAPPLFVVADGMGGAQAGEVAAGIAVDTLRELAPAGDTLLAAAAEANARIFARANEQAESAGMGTTLTAFVLEDDGQLARFVHIGDSRAYLLRGDRLKQLSDDHSLVGEWLRGGAITPEEAAVNRYRSVLSRALGTEPEAEIDEFVVDLQADDVLLLCSDGLSGVVPDEVIADKLKAEDPAAAARELIDEAKSRGGHDNITVVIVRLQAADDGTTQPLPAAGNENDIVVTRISAAGSAVRVDSAESAAGNSTAAPPAGVGTDGPLIGVSAIPPAGVSAAPPARPVRPARWPRRLLIGAVALVVLLAGFSLALNEVFYVGTSDGYVAIYRGLPWELAGVGVHKIYLRSDVTMDSLSKQDQSHVNRHSLSSRGAAMDYVDRLSERLRTRRAGGTP